jgi:hypothetical protein
MAVVEEAVVSSETTITGTPMQVEGCSVAVLDRTTTEVISIMVAYSVSVNLPF